MDSFVLMDETGALDEHAAGTARGIEHASVIGLKDLHDQADDAARCEEFAAFLPLRAGELAEEVFIDSTEGVIVETRRESRKLS